MKQIIVAVDNKVPLPEFDFDHELITHDKTSPEELGERIKKATIVLTSATPITKDSIESAPRLKLVACNGTGTDHVDKHALRERGIVLCNVPHASAESVAEHAIALMYAVRRKLPALNQETVEGKAWEHESSGIELLGRPQRLNKNEVVVIIGFGQIGQKVADLTRRMGMDTKVAERKGATKTRPGRIHFEDALRVGTIFIIAAPSTDQTQGMIGEPELAKMNSSALIINVGRGGLVDELALVAALRSHKLAGAGIDVFQCEPPSNGSCPLLDRTVPNLILTPHVGWYSDETVAATKATIVQNLKSFVEGRP